MVSCSGDWNPWVSFFCEAVQGQCESIIAGAMRLLSWLTESRRLVQERRWTGAIHRLLDDRVEWPIVTIADTAERYGVSPMNATRMINHLVEIGVVHELTGRTYARIFGATAVMDIVDMI